ncbi:MAG: cupin domain-containing protein [Hyphomonadaceae bacterium]
MDPLSDILTMLTVRRVAQARFESRGPYTLRFAPYEHMKFGAVLCGRMRILLEGLPPLDLHSGDCYLLTDGRPHRSDSGEGGPALDGDALFAEGRDEDGVVRLGGGPHDKVVLAGGFVFDEEGAAWLRSALPPVIHIAASSPAAAPLRETLRLLNVERQVGAPGEAVIVDRLADILLVQAIRAHLAGAGPQEASWLAGLADPRLGRALRRLHEDVAADWTVAKLASAAGMSRSSFAQRFRERVGMAPADYLMRWRMYRVRRSLMHTDLSFSVIAAQNGYRSRTSCSQSFKKMFGYSPEGLRSRCALAHSSV